MKIKCTTNLDAYKTNCFPENLTFVPRKGEFVQVVPVFREYYLKMNLPALLEVQLVVHAEWGVVVELGYSKIQQQKLNLK